MEKMRKRNENGTNRERKRPRRLEWTRPHVGRGGVSQRPLRRLISIAAAAPPRKERGRMSYLDAIKISSAGTQGLPSTLLKE